MNSRHSKHIKSRIQGNVTINTIMSLNKGRAGCSWAASQLTRPYFSMPNISSMANETAETIIQPPSATTVPTRSKSLPELSVAVPVTCRYVDLQNSDAAIKDLAVTVVKPRSRSCTLNDMDLDVAKSRASYYASSRLTKMYCSTSNILLMERETAIRVPSTTIGTDGVEDTDQTQCSDVGLLCETAGYICCDNGPDGKDKQGQIYKRRSFGKRIKKFFRRLLCCV